MKYVFAFDFDKTITLNDVVVDMLDKYSTLDWRAIEAKVDTGEITLRECLALEVRHPCPLTLKSAFLLGPS